MASLNVRRAVPLAVAAGVLAVASTAAAQVPPAGAPAVGPPPGFGGTLVADPAFAGGGGNGGSGGGEGGAGGQPQQPQQQSQPPPAKLRLTNAGINRAKRRVVAQIACQTSGKLTLRTWTDAFLGAKHFGCAGGTVRVRIKLTRKRFRTLRRSDWKIRFILAGGGERHGYRGQLRAPKAGSSRNAQRAGLNLVGAGELGTLGAARAKAHASAGLYWTGAEGYCGLYLENNPFGAGTFTYRLTAPPIPNSTPGAGPDVGQVRYYWYRYGVGWVGDSGWTPPFTIPDEGTGAIFIGEGWEYILLPDAHAWYAGAIAIWWRNAGIADWNWVSTYPRNAFNPVVDGTWCGTDP